MQPMPASIAICGASNSANPTVAPIMITAYDPMVTTRHRLRTPGRMISTAPNDSFARRPSSSAPKVAQNFFVVSASTERGSAAM